MLRLASALMLLCLGVFAGSSLAQTADFDFGNWDRSRWLPVRESRFPQTVPFVQRDGYIENLLPTDATEEDIVAAKEGIGVAMLFLRDFRAQGLAVRCEMAFDRNGAPAINFRAQREGEVTGVAYSLVLYEKGVNLWKYSDGKWSKTGAAEVEIGAGEFHEVRLYARGGRFAVYVDGVKRLNCADPDPLPVGEVGIWSGEGPCRFRSFRIRSLDAAQSGL